MGHLIVMRKPWQKTFIIVKGVMIKVWIEEENSGGQTKLSFDAPAEAVILREEVYHRKISLALAKKNLVGAQESGNVIFYDDNDDSDEDRGNE